MTSPGFAQAVTAAMPPNNGVRVGEVVSINPLRINLAGGIIAAGILGSYSPVVGDFVSLIREEGTWLALGATGTPAATGTALATVARTSDATQAATAVVLPDEQLFLPVAPYSFYGLTAYLIFTATTTADLRYDLSTPAGTTFTANTWNFQVSGALGSQGSDTRVFTNTTQLQPPAGGTTFSTQRTQISVMGHLQTDAAGGFATWRWNTNIAEASNVTLHKGSWFKLERMA